MPCCREVFVFGHGDIRRYRRKRETTTGGVLAENHAKEPHNLTPQAFESTVSSSNVSLQAIRRGFGFRKPLLRTRPVSVPIDRFCRKKVQAIDFVKGKKWMATEWHDDIFIGRRNDDKRRLFRSMYIQRKNEFDSGGEYARCLRQGRAKLSHGPSYKSPARLLARPRFIIVCKCIR